MLEPVQCRMARAALKWSAEDLAHASGVSASTIRRFERNGGGLHFHNLRLIFRALEDAGVILLGPGDIIDGGPGVRLRKATADAG